MTKSFAELRRHGVINLAIMPIGAYNPWIHYTLLARAGGGNGKCGRREVHHAGSSSNRSD